MSGPGADEYVALLRQIDDVMGGRGTSTVFTFSSALSCWLRAMPSSSDPKTRRVLIDINTLLRLKAALDYRRWTSSWRATSPKPMFQSEINAVIVAQHLGWPSASDSPELNGESLGLNGDTIEALESSIRRLIDRLGAVAPLTITVGRTVGFQPIG